MGKREAPKRPLYIDRGIPCPGPKEPMGPRTDAGRLARQLKVDESMFCATKAAYETARGVVYQLGGKVLTRKRFEDGEWGWRVWRIA